MTTQKSSKKRPSSRQRPPTTSASAKPATLGFVAAVVGTFLALIAIVAGLVIVLRPGLSPQTVAREAVAAMSEKGFVNWTLESGSQSRGHYVSDTQGDFDFVAGLPVTGPIAVDAYNHYLYVNTSQLYWESVSLSPSLAGHYNHSWVNTGNEKLVGAVPADYYITQALGLSPKGLRLGATSTVNGSRVLALYSPKSSMHEVVLVEDHSPYLPQEIVVTMNHHRDTIRLNYQPTAVPLPSPRWEMSGTEPEATGFGTKYPVANNSVVQALHTAVLAASWDSYASNLKISREYALAGWSALQVSDSAVTLAKSSGAVLSAALLTEASAGTRVRLLSTGEVAGAVVRLGVTMPTGTVVGVCMKEPRNLKTAPLVLSVGAKHC